MKKSRFEVENKFNAEDVDLDHFLDWCWSRCPSSYKEEVSTDSYYTQGRNVVRSRWTENGIVLTTKKRTSQGSLQVRKETEVTLVKDDGILEAHDFLLAAGWKPQFTIAKRAHVFTFSERGDARGKADIEVVFYDAEVIPNKLLGHFIEIEVKGGVSVDYAESLLGAWTNVIRKALHLSKPLNESLYEMACEISL